MKTSIRFAVTIVPALLAPAALVTGCASAGAPQAAMTSRFSAMGLALPVPGDLALRHLERRCAEFQRADRLPGHRQAP